MLNKLRSKASCLYTGCFFEKSVFDILRTFHRFARAYTFSSFLKRQSCFLSQNSILPNPIKLPIKKSKLCQQLTSLLHRISSPYVKARSANIRNARKRRKNLFKVKNLFCVNDVVLVFALLTLNK